MSQWIEREFKSLWPILHKYIRATYYSLLDYVLSFVDLIVAIEALTLQINTQNLYSASFESSP